MTDPNPFDALMLDATLSGIQEDAPPSQMEAALRSIANAISTADPIRRAVIQDAVVRRLRRAGVSSPNTLARVLFVPEKPKAAILSNPALFPPVEPWPHPVDGSRLLNDTASLIRRFIVLSPAAADAEALWCLHTYVHDMANVSPILCLRSPGKRCGKTRNLQILGCFVRRPLHTSNVTVAALTRAIDHYGPTLLIDEADTIFTNGSNAELRGILNAGLYRATAFVLRCRGERHGPRACSIWCPKAIALIGRLPSTLEDRSIVVSLRRRDREQSIEVLPLRYALLRTGTAASKSQPLGSRSHGPLTQRDRICTRDASRSRAGSLASAAHHRRDHRRRLAGPGTAGSG